jgi:hypothetical protein
MDQRPRQSGADRSNRRRQKLAGLSARPQGMPGQPVSPLPARAPAGRGACWRAATVAIPGFCATSAAPTFLILDDWGLEPLDAAARHDLLEILEERYGRRSTMITSQLPVAHRTRWRKHPPDLSKADQERLTNNHHRCQKLTCWKNRVPGRFEIGTLGEIISESWARWGRNSRAN